MWGRKESLRLQQNECRLPMTSFYNVWQGKQCSSARGTEPVGGVDALRLQPHLYVSTPCSGCPHHIRSLWFSLNPLGFSPPCFWMYELSLPFTLQPTRSLYTLPLPKSLQS
ncbi:uncharacterized protein WM277_008955 isoform 1-T1 [Molossus nigricans]